MTIIALDGGSATGKHTLGIGLKNHFNYAYLDTGALYRTVAWQVLKEGGDPNDTAFAEKIARSLPLDKIEILQNNPEIRTEKVGLATSVVSAIKEVRSALLDFQRNFAKNPLDINGNPLNGAILDGRDIGTVVCPEAPIKLFLVADVKIRAVRRLKELQSKGINAILEEVLSDMIERDRRDSERALAPTKAANDAFIIDTSDLTPQAVLTMTLNYIHSRSLSP